MWISAHTPALDTAFMNTGVSLTFYFHPTAQFSVLGNYQQHSDAGYLPKERRYGPGGPLDFIHQIWEQAFGIGYRGKIPIYFYFHRICFHLLDDRGLEAPIWTSFPLGIGTFAPYTNPVLGDPSQPAFQQQWYFGYGPTLRSGDATLWQNNSRVLGEGWIRYAAAQKLPIANVQVFGYTEFYLQRCLSHLKYRHQFRTEAGLAHSLKNGEWRLLIGQLWKDNTYQFPMGKKFYYRLEFLLE
ncbi:MAG: hypothetical protein N2450_06715 [bacterium]|nr:hypothetical protein [bacterium]